MNLNEPFVWITQQLSPSTREYPHKFLSEPVTAMPSISMEHAWNIAMEHFPGGKLNAIYPPASGTVVFTVVQRNVPQLSAF